MQVERALTGDFYCNFHFLMVPHPLDDVKVKRAFDIIQGM